METWKNIAGIIGALAILYWTFMMKKRNTVVQVVVVAAIAAGYYFFFYDQEAKTYSGGPLLPRNPEVTGGHFSQNY